MLTGVLDDGYVLYLNSTNDEWWGWTAAHRDGSPSTLTPAEKRVFDTIEWVITRYKIDRNAVYLSGVSMGGCGALALGLPHGDIFAAVLVVVPAGTEYAALRMGFPAALASDASSYEHDSQKQRISRVSRARPRRSFSTSPHRMMTGQKPSRSCYKRRRLDRCH